MDKSENMLIPARIDYNEIKTLKCESRQKLIKIRPDNLGQASRIPGLIPLILPSYLYGLNQRAI